MGGALSLPISWISSSPLPFGSPPKPYHREDWGHQRGRWCIPAILPTPFSLRPLELPPRNPPRRVLDVGAGLGLPGLPLAIVWPTTEVVSLERSVRRADLGRRAILLLGLDKVTVATEQLQEWRAPADFIVSRAVSSPLKLRRPLSRPLLPSGVAALGGSHRSRPNVVGYRVSEIPDKVIRNPVWLLIMKGA